MTRKNVHEETISLCSEIELSEENSRSEYKEIM
jgi:hypothetical protein